MQTFKELHRQFTNFLQTHPFDREPIGLYEPVDYIMNMKGKQIRPVLLLMAHNLYNDSVERVLALAYAIELFHSFSLLHDDVMDQAEVRRGQPTVHMKYGINTAILSGDVMLIYVYKFITESVPVEYLSEVLQIFNKVAIEVCEGQQMDMDFENRDDVSILEYIQMIGLKTAVLLAGALQIGALTGGASKEDATNLYNFGKYIGLAFQIQDDFLDTFGDQATFGKKIGGDIMQNKKTYLYLKAKEMAKGEDLKMLNAYYDGSSQKESVKIPAVTKLFKALAVDQYASELKEEYQKKAFGYLKAVSSSEERKKPLRDLANRLMGRKV
ncbi:MAG: geranylgeranyl diphosphate synthase type II [Polaribacter sp.]|jgi:geranylgeranyl diphosphate synthase type II